MGGLERPAHGFAIALTATNILWAFVGCLLGTAFVLPASTVTIALLLAAHDAARADLGADHVLRRLLRRDVRRLHDVDPAQHAGRVGVDRDLARGQRDARSADAPARRSRPQAIGSFVAGTIATILVTLVAPPVAEWGLSFGPAEKFSLMVLAFMTISAVLGQSALRGFASLFFGLFLGLIGTDAMSGQVRFALGIQELYDGIDVVVVAVGLFAIGETLYVASHERRVVETIERIRGSLWMSKADFRRSIGPWLRGTAIGFPFGTMPAGGAEIPTFLSYATEKKLHKGPDKFGEGAIEGVAGPEASEQTPRRSPPR